MARTRNGLIDFEVAEEAAPVVGRASYGGADLAPDGGTPVPWKRERKSITPTGFNVRRESVDRNAMEEFGNSPAPDTRRVRGLVMNDGTRAYAENPMQTPVAPRQIDYGNIAQTNAMGRVIGGLRRRFVEEQSGRNRLTGEQREMQAAGVDAAKYGFMSPRLRGRQQMADERAYGLQRRQIVADSMVDQADSTGYWNEKAAQAQAAGMVGAATAQAQGETARALFGRRDQPAPRQVPAGLRFIQADGRIYAADHERQQVIDVTPQQEPQKFASIEDAYASMTPEDRAVYEDAKQARDWWDRSIWFRALPGNDPRGIDKNKFRDTRSAKTVIAGLERKYGVTAGQGGQGKPLTTADKDRYLKQYGNPQAAAAAAKRDGFDVSRVVDAE